ncbi:MAG: thioredoxin-dependent thiol peroxidase [Anaerolineales bacterium]|nr:thioredoxin-dependent thiol peroxidase [Anaerolineales bacterium]MCS7247801.1 thioredoxin-dependent thiol peroxidase [Anaerolineales bacterium]MDW8161611.1 thioredoxin-dependent thiol peroxidase [Anaerolineales bacterium]MDW8446301.1 thioredoxin-dependent thiol peroxidase [Anaerolineales bacterium]
MPLTAGNPAPDFTLPDENGELRRLSDYRGKVVVLYFYPKDDTPGCTTEACEFRDAYAEYEKAGISILGVSPDDVKKHQKFKAKHSLPFPLLADTDHAVCEMYGVWGRKKFRGKEYEGVFRTTFVIGKDGTILRVFENVKPEGHSREVLKVVEELEG